jgi:hypothetical protein
VGHHRALSFAALSIFGDVPKQFSFENVSCLGNETSFEDCSFEDGENCPSGKGAGVVCLDEKGDILFDF